MRTKIILLSSTVLLSAGITMHHFRYCPLQHLKTALSHHQPSTTAKAAEAAKAPRGAKATKSTEVLALNR
ncbi:MAG TPA: hypothetical protein VHC96_02465 [Puia sp.]|jgi:hypothetical protein|nr:hypothetical protein [Puia sp.]